MATRKSTPKSSPKTERISAVSKKSANTAHQKILDQLHELNGRFHIKKPQRFTAFPDLVETQLRGYDDFVNFYLNKLFADSVPIRDLGGETLQLTVSDLKISDATESIETCKKKELTYGGIITARVKLHDATTTKELFNKRVNLGTMPLLTPQATYIINGIEKVIISQIVRSYGIFYSYKDLKPGFKLIPQAGPRLETSIEKTGVVVARINKLRKFPFTTLLRVFGLETDESIRAAFDGVFDEDDVDYLELTLKKDSTTDAISAAEFIYNKLRPGELVDPESALDYIKSMFLDPARIHVGKIARRKINAKLGLDKKIDDATTTTFDIDDFVGSFKYLVNLSNQKKGFYTDDSDHLSNKRVRTMGEVLHGHLQPVMRKFVKAVRGKLSVLNTEETLKITDIANFKMIDNSIKSFFATSQLAQFLDQTNPLAEIENKRKITALGPGGLKRETAKFEVRDVHASHYGRICPIETPEWQNIGLVTHLALYARIDDEGFIMTPAFKIFHEVPAKSDALLDRIAKNDIFELDAKGKPTKKLIIAEGQYITADIAKKIEKFYGKLKKPVRVQPFFSGEIDRISPENDEKCIIADSATPIDDHGTLLNKRVPGRHYDEMKTFHVNDVTHIDINPTQIFSPNTSLIPFVNHNDAVRASVATSQHRQALPLLKNDAPPVGTGLEGEVLRMTNAIILAEEDGEILYADGRRIKIKYKSGIKEHKLLNYQRSNHKTALHQELRVVTGQKVKAGDILAEGPCAQNGELAVGKSLRVAFMTRDGYNYEDAIVVSRRLVKDDELTSIQIEEHEIEVADTKLGPEQTTNDIPGVPMGKLSNLDDDGIVRIGAGVKGGDILVGKITPKTEGELTPEEKLIQAIFGDKSRSVKDTSLYLPAGSEWKVIDVITLDAKKWDNLQAGVRKKIKVYVATTRKIEVGDKLAGKHGNKGIVAIVVPEEDMPFTPDGQPVDVCLNPLGVPSRMNIGQLYENQLGLIAKTLGVNFAVPSFSGVSTDDIRQLAIDLELPADLKFQVFSGKTGEAYDRPVTIGFMHVLKLVHMVEDKIHARSVGPYALITQQPLGGKSRQGGQRFGEMEVRALEAYSAVHTLQEMLTVKSDDVVGRNKLYESIIRAQEPKIGGLPESFNLLTHLFRGLGQNIQPLDEEQLERIHQERIQKIMDLGLSGVLEKTQAKSDDTDEVPTTDEGTVDEKSEMIDTVIQEMKDSGEMEDEE